MSAATILDLGQDMGRTLHAIDVLVSIQRRLEDARDHTSLHHFLRLAPDELELIVRLEAGIP